jgi:hypothetical protein
MTTCSRRSVLSPPIVRHFEFTRLHDQSIALAYQALIPVVSRHLERPRSSYYDNEPAVTTTQELRSRARGALPAMLTQDLRVATHSRVSGEQQAREGTIASQLEAITQRVTSDALKCEPKRKLEPSLVIA